MAPPRPDIHRKAEDLAAGLPPLLVAAERVASTVSQGVHGRRRVGQGETFWQFRRYQPGDSTQLIDWRQSAKSQPVYVRETEWEAAQSVWLWRDASPSMRYRSTDALPTKAERADLLLLALASLLVRGGEHVALLGTGRAPAADRAALNRLAAVLQEEARPLAAIVDEGAGSLAALIRDGTAHEKNLPVFEVLPRYARLVVIGDFLSPLEDVKSAVGAFASRGVRGHMVQVLDPAEETLPFSGRVRFEGLENEGDILVGKAEAIRKYYRANMINHRRGLKALARSAGWTFAAHHTDRSPATALLALFLVLSQTVKE